MEQPYPRILGQVPIPVRYVTYGTRASFCKEIVENLQFGTALKVQFESEDEAQHARHQIHNMAYLKWSQKGYLRTKADGNIVYVWLVRDPAMELTATPVRVDQHSIFTPK